MGKGKKASGKSNANEPAKPEASSAAPKLTPMQTAFVKAYLADPQRNGTQAAITAGYAETSAASQAYENLRKPEILAAIEVELEARYKRLDITGDRIASELMLLGTFDPRDAYDEAGLILPLCKMPEHIRRAIASVELSDKTLRVKFAEKRPALELLLKMQGKVVEKHEHTGKNGGPIETKDLTAATTDELRAELEALRGKQAAKKPKR